MFTWICPRCGRENPPSYTECPDCKARAEAEARDREAAPVPEPVYQQAVAPPPPAPPAPAPPVFRQPLPTPPESRPVIPDPPPSPQPHAREQYQQQQQQRRPEYPPPPSRGLPTWLLSLLFAFAFLGLGALVYFGYQRFTTGGKAGFTGGETPANAPKPKAASSLQKYIEVVGIRLTSDSKKKPLARFVVVNHANSELNDLTANVTLWASTSRSEEDSVGTFSFKLASIGPNEAKEISTPFKTKLKIYELPDWQNATPEVQITAP